MATLRLRWSEHEARKPYARPFMVSFVDDSGTDLGSVALNGADLLYWRQFGAAVATLSGELFLLDPVDSAADPQRAWLEMLTGLLPELAVTTVTPRSSFDHQNGRVFGFEVACGHGGGAVVDAATLLEYQDCQAALAHQTGRLLRVAAVEEIDEPGPRRHAWLLCLRDLVTRPAAEEAMAEHWPWH
ncbi:MAG TPA: hypothetical protein VG520_00985 [Candidatus Dormibacteraeota bacterium]|nr:hypothetical protein [Candidatus Dormibacteraeota bacterium]